MLGIHVIVVKIDTNLGNLPLSYNNNRVLVVPTVGKRPMSEGNTQDECPLSRNDPYFTHKYVSRIVVLRDYSQSII